VTPHVTLVVQSVLAGVFSANAHLRIGDFLPPRHHHMVDVDGVGPGHSRRLSTRRSRRSKIFHWTRLLWLNEFTDRELIVAHCSRSARGRVRFITTASQPPMSITHIRPVSIPISIPVAYPFEKHVHFIDIACVTGVVHSSL
jgi:hypothetical protein